MAGEVEDKVFWEVIFSSIVNAAFLFVATLVLWPMGNGGLAWQFTKGFLLLWAIVYGTFPLLHFLHRTARIDMNSRANAFVISNALVSCFLQCGWAAFAALAVEDRTANLGFWPNIMLHLFGVASVLAAFFVVSSAYFGHIYRLISLPLALIGYTAFSVWPEKALFMYGWFLRLF